MSDRPIDYDAMLHMAHGVTDDGGPFYALARAYISLCEAWNAKNERFLALVAEDDRNCTFCRGAGETSDITCSECGGERTYVAQLRRRMERKP